VLSSGTVPSFRSPTLGDISLGLRQEGYAQLQNTFGNLGLVLDLNLLPLRWGAGCRSDPAPRSGGPH
jgi:hypothetical protein